LSGNVTGNITGNAETVTNGVYTNQSYSDPSWITSIADSKIQGEARNSWDSVYSYVNQNSGIEQNQQLTTTFVLNNSSNILAVDTLVNNNSANWQVSYNVSTTYQNTSGTFATNTLLQSTSSLLTPLSVTNTLTSQLMTNDTFNSYQTSVASSTSTLLPISTYQNASGNFATNTLLNSVSSLLTPLTVTNTLTSQLVLNSNFTIYQTSVASSTATLLPTSIYQNASGNFVFNSLLQSTSSLLTPLTVTNTLTSQLVTNNTFNSYQTNVASSTATLLPTSIYQNASANWQNASDSLDFILINTNFNIISNRQYLVDTSSSIINTTLPPTPSIGDNVTLIDSYNTWVSNPLIINNNGNFLQTYNEPLTANISGYQFKLVYVGGSYGWKIV
jgi:hypothetical protein